VDGVSPLDPEEQRRRQLEQQRGNRRLRSLCRTVGDAIRALDHAAELASAAGEDLPDVVAHARHQLDAWHRELLVRTQHGMSRPRRPGQGP
jgi:hypothetical protein